MPKPKAQVNAIYGSRKGHSVVSDVKELPRLSGGSFWKDIWENRKEIRKAKPGVKPSVSGTPYSFWVCRTDADPIVC